MKHFFFILSLLFLTGLAIAAWLPGLITPHNATDQDASAVLSPPSRAHFTGTDSLGRDQLARLLDAARVSLIVSVAATAIALLIGLLWGLGAGMAPPTISSLLMRTVDVLYAIPDLLMFILMGLFLGRNTGGIIIALSSLSWLGIARLAHQETLKYREQDFVTAARALGVKPANIAIRHILPQLREALLVALIFKIPALIAMESALSFIGLGLAPPHASFGTLAKEGFDAYLFYPHLIAFPFLFTFLTVFSFYTVGNALKQSR